MDLQEQTRQYWSVRCRSLRQFAWKMGSILRYLKSLVFLSKQRYASMIVLCPWLWQRRTKCYSPIVSNDSQFLWLTITLLFVLSVRLIQTKPIQASRTQIIFLRGRSLRLRSTIQLNLPFMPIFQPLNLQTSQTRLVAELSLQWASPFMLQAAKNYISLPTCWMWTMEDISVSVQSSQSIWLSRQALFLLKMTRSALFYILYILNWSCRYRFYRQYLFFNLKPSRSYYTIIITLGAKNTITQFQKINKLRCFRLLGLLSYSNVAMCDPSSFIEQLFRAESPTLVGLKSIYGRLASSSGYTLKHLQKGMVMVLAWLAYAEITYLYLLSICWTMWERTIEIIAILSKSVILNMDDLNQWIIIQKIKGYIKVLYGQNIYGCLPYGQGYQGAACVGSYQQLVSNFYGLSYFTCAMICPLLLPYRTFLSLTHHCYWNCQWSQRVRPMTSFLPYASIINTSSLATSIDQYENKGLLHCNFGGDV